MVEQGFIKMLNHCARLATWIAFIAIFLNLVDAVALPATAALDLPKAPGINLKLGGTPASMGEGSYPRATYLFDGSLLGIYTAFKGNITVLTVVNSNDDSKTWNKIGTITRGSTATQDIDNGFLLQLPGGKILATFRNHDRTTSGDYKTFRITVCVSDDSGKTWKFLSEPQIETNKGESIDPTPWYLSTRS